MEVLISGGRGSKGGASTSYVPVFQSGVGQHVVVHIYHQLTSIRALYLDIDKDISSFIMGGERNTVRSVESSYPKLSAGPVGKKIHDIYEQRLRQFLDRGQYRNEGLIP